jgi:hypothetical protein
MYPVEKYITEEYCIHHTGLHLVSIFVSDYIFEDYLVNITRSYVFRAHPTHAVDSFFGIVL